jgi:hypothetical protein
MKTKKFRTLPDKLMEENIEQELQWQTASVIRASVKPITSPAHKKDAHFTRQIRRASAKEKSPSLPSNHWITKRS